MTISGKFAYFPMHQENYCTVDSQFITTSSPATVWMEKNEGVRTAFTNQEINNFFQLFDEERCIITDFQIYEYEDNAPPRRLQYDENEYVNADSYS
jgi:hypothetical protein